MHRKARGCGRHRSYRHAPPSGFGHACVTHRWKGARAWNQHKRGPGRPRKAEPFDGPVVLTLSLKREKLEIELTEPTRRELEEYLSWVEERAPHLDPGDSLFTTFEYAITTLLRTDRKWRQRVRELRGGPGARRTSRRRPQATSSNNPRASEGPPEPLQDRRNQ